MLTFLKKKLPKGFKRNVQKIIVFPYIIYCQYINKRKIWIRWDTSDVNVFYHTFIEHEYSIPYSLGNPKVIIDAGANIGLSSMVFATSYPNARIIAIEPESSNFDLLKKNTQDFLNIIPLQKGLWKNDVNLIIENPENEKWSFITKEVKETEKYDIQGISVETLLNDYNIDMIDIFKIDIEGSEKVIFSENEEKWIKRTKWIMIEVHGPECKSVFENAMSKYGFKHIYTNGENQFFQHCS